MKKDEKKRIYRGYIYTYICLYIYVILEAALEEVKRKKIPPKIKNWMFFRSLCICIYTHTNFETVETIRDS